MPLKITLAHIKTSFVSELKKAWPNNITINTTLSFYYHINYKKTKYARVSMRISVWRLPTNKNGTILGLTLLKLIKAAHTESGFKP